ncbi:MAG: hypothetical protein ACE5R4_15980 [Armatimonadota bacterium]
MQVHADEHADRLLSLFPDSGAPTFFEKDSKLELQRSFQYWARDSRWHPEVNEADVFHARLKHKSVEERCWEIGIGKGGQMYSIASSFGEAMPPQSPDSQWVDETWQFTTIYEPLLGRDLPDSSRRFGNAFIHQSGIYTREEGDRPFYSPMLADSFDPEDRSFAVLSWAQIPDPSVNRSGVLVYAQYRDLGAGVIEVTYVIYNFEKHPMTNLSPWGGVRTSVFPEHVVANPDGSYRFFTPYRYGAEGCRINFDQTGGWAAVTQNAADPRSYAIAVVFGTDLDRQGEHYAKPRYDCGNSRHGTRDYTVQATVIRIKDTPGTAHLLRMYFIIGTLADAATKANKLAPYATYAPLDLTTEQTPLVSLYVGGAGVTRAQPPGTARPLCQVYAHPVRGSRPLFLIREVKTGRTFCTTDPYARCAREPFVNPLPEEHESFEKYQNRTVYRPFAGETEWLDLLGFALTEALPGHVPLASIEAARECFDPGECQGPEELFVRQAG